MTLENSRTAVDPWSRFVSYCSLVVAVGALAWALFGFGSLSNWGEPATDRLLDFATINARYEKEVEERNQRDEEFRNQWKQKQGEQLTAYKVAADGLLDEHRQLVNGLLAGGVKGASHMASTEESKASATVDEDGTDGEETDTKLSSDDVPLIPYTPVNGSAEDNDDAEGAKDGILRPLLAYVRESLKPGIDANTALLTIRNRGDSPAVLARIEFTPSLADDSIFEVESSSSNLVATEDEDILSIVFSHKDNLAAAGGKHGVYARELSEEHVIPAASDVRIRLAVTNSKHVGWGFYGTLKLEYNGLEPLTIEDAQLVFVAADDSIYRK